MERYGLVEDAIYLVHQLFESVVSHLLQLLLQFDVFTDSARSVVMMMMVAAIVVLFIVMVVATTTWLKYNRRRAWFQVPIQILV